MIARYCYRAETRSEKQRVAPKVFRLKGQAQVFQPETHYSYRAETRSEKQRVAPKDLRLHSLTASFHALYKKIAPATSITT
ncbi:hypothetical protein GCM10022296_07410 [Secundilactobacillus similis DSM 23365 = JCM 2765]